MKQILVFYVIAGLTFCGALAEAALADTTSDFLKSLEGSYRGGGTARIIGDSEDKILCQITNAFDAESDQLTMQGNCASVKGKSRVEGTISNVNGELSGVFLGSNEREEITKSSGRVENGKMELSLFLVDRQTGNLSRIRQVIAKTPAGLSAEIYRFDNKSNRFERSGTLLLNKR